MVEREEVWRRWIVKKSGEEVGKRREEEGRVGAWEKEEGG